MGVSLTYELMVFDVREENWLEISYNKLCNFIEKHHEVICSPFYQPPPKGKPLSPTIPKQKSFDPSGIYDDVPQGIYYPQQH